MTRFDELPVYIITKTDVGIDDGVLFCEVKDVLSIFNVESAEERHPESVPTLSAVTKFKITPFTAVILKLLRPELPGSPAVTAFSMIELKGIPIRSRITIDNILLSLLS